MKLKAKYQSAVDAIESQKGHKLTSNGLSLLTCSRCGEEGTYDKLSKLADFCAGKSPLALRRAAFKAERELIAVQEISTRALAMTELVATNAVQIALSVTSAAFQNHVSRATLYDCEAPSDAVRRRIIDAAKDMATKEMKRKRMWEGQDWRETCDRIAGQINAGNDPEAL
jgi:hypothetical protein